MSFNVSNSSSSAFVSGALGLNRASQGITESATNIAQRNQQSQTPQDLQTNAATQQIDQDRQAFPQGGNALTDDLLSLQVYSTNALASTKVLEVANQTVGRIIDELA